MSLRRHSRDLLDAPIRLTWTDESGNPQYSVGTCLDVSRSGLSIRVNLALPVRSYVCFQVVGHDDLRGSGSIRSCQRSGMHFVAGVEFSGGLRWISPAEDSEPEPTQLENS